MRHGPHETPRFGQSVVSRYVHTPQPCSCRASIATDLRPLCAARPALRGCHPLSIEDTYPVTIAVEEAVALSTTPHDSYLSIHRTLSAGYCAFDPAASSPFLGFPLGFRRSPLTSRPLGQKGK